MKANWRIKLRIAFARVSLTCVRGPPAMQPVRELLWRRRRRRRRRMASLMELPRPTGGIRMLLRDADADAETRQSRQTGTRMDPTLPLAATTSRRHLRSFAFSFPFRFVPFLLCPPSGRRSRSRRAIATTSEAQDHDCISFRFVGGG